MSNSSQFHHRQTLEMLGCGEEEESRQHCATTVVGVVRGSVMESVLEEMVACSLTEGCINPEGSNRGNHRQEQTAMNAIFCRRQMPNFGVCESDTKWTRSSDFGEDSDKEKTEEEVGGGRDLFITSDPEEWNRIEIYTRRVHPVKPYERMIK